MVYNYSLKMSFIDVGKVTGQKTISYINKNIKGDDHMTTLEI